MRVLNYIGMLDPNTLSGEVVVAKNDLKSLNLSGHHAIQYDISSFNSGFLNKLLRPVRLFIFPYEIFLIRKKIKFFKPDIIHLHTITPYMSISLLIYLSILGIPVVQTLHNVRWICLEGAYYRKDQYCDKCSGKSGFSGVINGCNKGVTRSFMLFFINKIVRIDKFLFKVVDCFIPVSDFIRRESVSNGFPSEKLVIKHNGIDLKNLQNISTKDHKREGVIFASRISKSKGSNILKFVMKKIKDPIYVMGTGPELADLKKYCNNNRYNHVHFLGKVSQKKCFSHMSSALCTIIPSQCGESFSLTAAESMSLGVPVIGSDVGGLSGLLKESAAGITVRSDNAQEFVNAINSLKNDKIMYDTLSKNGKKYTYEQLNLKKNSLALIGIYKKVLKEVALHDNSI